MSGKILSEEFTTFLQKRGNIFCKNCAFFMPNQQKKFGGMEQVDLVLEWRNSSSKKIFFSTRFVHIRTPVPKIFQHV
ncbi:MAG: hypothetical protein K2Y12_03385 [Chitinophagaceae bacterium]|nr:hypothetical protein [Chitinophagaceae bacterium]